MFGHIRRYATEYATEYVTGAVVRSADRTRPWADVVSPPGAIQKENRWKRDVICDITRFAPLALDTDVLVAAMRSRSGASWQLVDWALARKFTLLLTVPLVLEYEAVLRREEHRKVHGLTMPQLDEVIDSLVKVAEPVRIRFLWRPLLSDPRDDMVLETAVNDGADLLVTFKQKDFVAASKGFAHETVRPSEALDRLRRHAKH